MHIHLYTSIHGGGGIKGEALHLPRVSSLKILTHTTKTAASGMPLLVNAHAPPNEIIFSPFSTACRSNH